MLVLRPAAKDSQHWQGSFADWEEAEHQLEANDLAWAPPGSFAAALSTFHAALQEARHTIQQLNQVHLLSHQTNVTSARIACRPTASASTPFRMLKCIAQMQERQLLSSKQAEAQRAASMFEARQHVLEAQLGKCADRSSNLQKSGDSTAAELINHQQRAANLQLQLTKLQHQHNYTAASLSTAAQKLKELEQLPPKLIKVSKEADICRREMNTLSGSQAKVHESLQAYLHQEKELRRDLHLAEQHLAHVSQDYAVCQDTSAHLRFYVRQTKVRVLMKRQGLLMVLVMHPFVMCMTC